MIVLTDFYKDPDDKQSLIRFLSAANEFEVEELIATSLAYDDPSGDPTPSEADIKITRDLIRAGQLLKIDCSRR